MASRSRSLVCILAVGIVALMTCGPSFAGTPASTKQSKLARRMGNSKWVNTDDPEKSHPSGLYILPIKPEKPSVGYRWAFVPDEKGVLQYTKVVEAKPEFMGELYMGKFSGPIQSGGNGAYNHWGPSGDGVELKK
eukprot:TRINITY_DN5270_c0_g2_i1.p1 TRINITY_DN5270_c0_g2~~TRINITY_DN5270_c0_g2_i1.p1  ORF type:complete len:135 (-),score=28.94 TRINITY_DN5270_c0_g2_i1:136-540(-)